jgi:hypothetical protein
MQPPKPIDNVFAMSEPQHMLSKLLPGERGPLTDWLRFSN